MTSTVPDPNPTAGQAPPKRPSLLTEVGAALLTLVLVAIAGRLGLWQYDAWQAHRASEARDLTQLEPVGMTDVIGADDPFPAAYVGRPVEVAGEWIDGGFWVENREQDGVLGYWAVTPLAVGEVGQPAVLVVRGWAAEPAPGLLAESGAAEITGWLQPPDGTLAVDDDPNDDVFPEIRVADAIQRVDVDLYGAFVIADPERSGVSPGLEGAQLAAMPEVSSFSGLKNLLYAIEWWIFAAFAVYIWWRWRVDAHRAADAAEAEGQPADG